MRTKSALVGLGFISASSLLWAVDGNVSNFLFEDGISPMALAQICIFISALTLATYVCLFNRQLFTLAKKHYLAITILSATIALDAVTYYVAIDNLPVAIVIVLLDTTPIFVTIYHCIHERRFLNIQEAIALTLSVLGFVLAAGLQGANLAGLSIIGTVAALACAACFAVHLIVSERVQEEVPTTTITLYGYLFASFFVILFQPNLLHIFTNFQLTQLLPILFVGILGTLAPEILMLHAVKRLGATIISLMDAAQPAIFAALIAYFWFDQEMTGLQVVGSAFIVASVLILEIKLPLGEKNNHPEMKKIDNIVELPLTKEIPQAA